MTDSNNDPAKAGFFGARATFAAAGAVAVAASIVIAVLLFLIVSANGENGRLAEENAELSERLSTIDAEKQKEIDALANLLKKEMEASESVEVSFVEERETLEVQNDEFHERMVEAELERDEKRAEAERLAIEVELLARETGRLAPVVVPVDADWQWADVSLRDCFSQRFPPFEEFAFSDVSAISEMTAESLDEWASKRMSEIHGDVSLVEDVGEKILAGVGYGCWVLPARESK